MRQLQDDVNEREQAELRRLEGASQVVRRGGAAAAPPVHAQGGAVVTAPLPPKRWREVARGLGGRPTATCGGRGLLADVFWPGSNRIPTVFDHGFTGFRAPVLGMPISGNRAWSLSIERTFCGEHRAAE